METRRRSNRRKQPRPLLAGLYARVSKFNNDPETLLSQNQAMREYAARRGWTVAVEVSDARSDAVRRKIREKLLEAARRREIDVIVVWRLHDWVCTATDLMAMLQELEALGVGIVALTESLNVPRWASMNILSWLVPFVESDREIARERIRAGMAKARLHGKKPGRPMTAGFQAAEIRKLYQDGVAQAEIARRLQIGRTSVRRILRAGA